MKRRKVFPVSLQKIGERRNIQYLEGTNYIVLRIKGLKTQQFTFKHLKIKRVLKVYFDAK